MKQQSSDSIIEGNILIAEFMGSKSVSEVAKDLLYHQSWDWLIPVWRSVNLAIKGIIGKAKDEKPGLYHTSLDAKLQFACDTFDNAVFQSNPMAAQRIIVGLIEWLNDNITEQN